MNFLQALILGILQGATEFIPVSSSGHLVLVPWLLQWENPGLAFDAVLHLGTIGAVIAFFWRDLWALARAWLESIAERSIAVDPQRKTAWLLFFGTIPGALLGFFFEDFFESIFDSPCWVATLLLVTGWLLAASEYFSRKSARGHAISKMHQMTWLDTVLIGIAQGMAIAPGISRSGATIAAGLWRGLNRETAARYSFLLSAPIVVGAGMLQVIKIAVSSVTYGQISVLIVGFIAAAISGYLCIKFLLRYLQRRDLYPFAIYCWIAGFFCLIVFALRG